MFYRFKWYQSTLSFHKRHAVGIGSIFPMGSSSGGTPTQVGVFWTPIPGGGPDRMFCGGRDVYREAGYALHRRPSRMHG
jgi:hypothetical protein